MNRTKVTISREQYLAMKPIFTHFRQGDPFPDDVERITVQFPEVSIDFTISKPVPLRMESDDMMAVRTAVASFMDDENIKEFGLHTDIFTWAFMRLTKTKEDIFEALNHGYGEWIK